MIVLKVHKILYYKVRVSTGRVGSSLILQNIWVQPAALNCFSTRNLVKIQSAELKKILTLFFAPKSDSGDFLPFWVQPSELAFLTFEFSLCTHTACVAYTGCVAYTVFLGKFRINSGVLRVARGGSGAKAPPLAAPPKLAGRVAVSSWFIETTLAGWVLAFISVCLETRWLGGSFFMVYRNNAGRLGAGLHPCVLRNLLAGSKQRFLCAGTTLYYN